MSKRDLIIVGGGGHCKSCIDVIVSEGRFNIVGIVDIEDKLHQNVLNCEVIASDKNLPDLVSKYKNFFITIGSIKNPYKRIEKFEYLKILGATFPVIISPLAYVAKSASIEEGTIVMHKAFVNVDVRIGKNCIINTSSIIEHESSIGNYSNISTGSIINGTCCIGNRVFIGSNSTVFNNTDIGDGAIIGAGSVVTKSIDQEGLYYGDKLKCTEKGIVINEQSL